MASRTYRSTNPLNALQKGNLGSSVQCVNLASRIPAIINPVCQQYRLGVEITGAECFIETKTIRLPDEDVYGIDPNEDPNANIKKVVVLNLILPDNSCLARLKQIEPSIKSALQARGIVSLEIAGIVLPRHFRAR